MSQRISRTAANAVVAAIALLCARPLEAQSTMRATRVASGLDHPVGAWAPTCDFNRLFILELASGSSGKIRVLDVSQTPPVLAPTPYLTISPITIGGEDGLLGLAFHPDFANNGYLFVLYTSVAGDLQVMRYQANAPYMTSGSANLGSASRVMTISHPVWQYHNGGWLGFGPDGYLYIATGEGPANAQDLGSRLGKILRVDVNGDDFPGDPANNYANPPSNPYFGATPGLDEIWHSGLRNPWRASFDRATGDMWIGEVGNAAFEEIDFVAAGLGGSNFGWHCMEGYSCTGVGSCTCNDPALTLPVHAYAHTSGNSCVVGGYRYRGAAMCSFQGLYFFADFTSARVWTAEWNGSSLQNLTDRSAELAAGGGPAIQLLTSFGEDAAGEIYICDMLGDVFRIEPNAIVDCNQNGTDDACDLANGTSHDWNADGVIDECQPTGATNCFGDGTTPTACPCSNPGALGRGCDNSAVTGGARLDGYGDPLLDSVVLVSNGELPTAMTLFLQGDARNINGLVFGDGLRCITGLLIRLYAGAASDGLAYAPGPGAPPITVRSTALGDPLAPNTGVRRYYQAFYRDPRLGLCTSPSGDTWNISSMLTVVW